MPVHIITSVIIIYEPGRQCCSRELAQSLEEAFSCGESPFISTTTLNITIYHIMPATDITLFEEIICKAYVCMLCPHRNMRGQVVKHKYYYSITTGVTNGQMRPRIYQVGMKTHICITLFIMISHNNCTCTHVVNFRVVIYYYSTHHIYYTQQT